VEKPAKGRAALGDVWKGDAEKTSTPPKFRKSGLGCCNISKGQKGKTKVEKTLFPKTAKSLNDPPHAPQLGPGKNKPPVKGRGNGGKEGQAQERSFYEKMTENPNSAFLKSRLPRKNDSFAVRLKDGCRNAKNPRRQTEGNEKSQKKN